MSVTPLIDTTPQVLSSAEVIIAPVVQEVETVEKFYFDKVPVPLKDLIGDDRLYEIAKCESGLRQYEENGDVLRGRVNPKDVGILQINEYYWLKKSKEMGIDIYSLQGNIQMAHYILKVQGYKAWMCWDTVKHKFPSI